MPVTTSTVAAPVDSIERPINPEIAKSAFWIEDLERQVKRLIELSREVDIEDGRENEFSRALRRFVLQFGNDAIIELDRYVSSGTCGPLWTAQTLRRLGSIDDTTTHEHRRQLLERALTNSSGVIIRDGALLGLSNMGDSRSAPCVELAIGKETYPALREDMKRALRDLLEVRGSPIADPSA